MLNKFKKVILIIFILVTYIDAEKLTLADYLEVLQKTHPVFKAYDSEIKALKKDVDASYGIADFELSAKAQYRKEDPVQPGVFTPLETENLDANVSLSKKLISSGTTLALEVTQNNQSRLDRQIGDIDVEFFPADFYQSGAFLKVSQSLFKNRSGFINRYNIERALLNEETGKLNNAEQKEKELLAFASNYIEWVRLYEQYLLVKARLKLSKDQFEQMKRKRSSALITEADLLRQEQDLWKSEKNFYESEALFLAKGKEINESLSLEGKKSTPSFKFYDLEKFKSFKNDSELDNLRVLKSINVSKSIETLNKNLAKENSKQDFTLELGAGLQSGGIGQSDAYQYDEPNLFAGISYKRFLNQTYERNSKLAAELREIKQKRLYESYKRKLKGDIGSIKIFLANLRRAIESAKKQIKAATKRTVAENKLYNQGRGELNFVIQSNDSELASKLQLVNLIGSYQQSYLRYRELIDNLM